MLRISVITICYNSVATVRDAVESVLGQDYSNLEYIVVDGGSSDGTLEILSAYSDRIEKVISEPDEGIYDAMNKGILASSGDIICILNSDDVYASENALSQVARVFHETGADTVFADLVQVRRNDLDQVVRYYDSGSFRPERLRWGWMPAHPTFAARRSIYERWGLYSTSFRIAADYEMMVRLYHGAKVSFTHLPVVLVKMRAGGVSSSGITSSIVLNTEIVRACRKNGLYTNMFFLLLKIPMKLLELVRRPV